ncbi:expressed unknown protein [Seminavis robusta]|uniref:Uncharacterized protein n=1 Tax=Seminavis robusta TaxID=568900 RepID=A0A9N8EY12_9STRA|nr:expressed unknown protein [Seminavis robusta]|eukprot:Sro2133_g315910.1 n/a (195) ;mRNA; r:5938-6522
MCQTTALMQFMLENQFSLKDCELVQDNAVAPSSNVSLSMSLSNNSSTINNSSSRHSHPGRRRSSRSSRVGRQQQQRRQRRSSSEFASSSQQGEVSRAQLCRWQSYPLTRSTSPPQTRLPQQAPLRRAGTYPPSTPSSPSITPPQQPKRRASITRPPMEDLDLNMATFLKLAEELQDDDSSTTTASSISTDDDDE